MAFSASDRALSSGAAELQLPSVTAKALHLLFRVSWLIQHLTGLSLPVQQSCGSLRSQREPSICCFEFHCYSGSGRALPSGAAEPQLPSVTVRALYLTLRVPHLAFHRATHSPAGSACRPTRRAVAPVKHRTTPLSRPAASSHTLLFFFTARIYLGGY